MDFTLGFIIVALIVIFGVDLYLLVRRGYPTTISATLLRMSRDYPIIPFLFGIVFGHLWWSQSVEQTTPKTACEVSDESR